MATKIIPPPKGLTDGFVRHLKPQDKRYDVADKSCSGLRVRVGTTGKKSFVWFYSDPDTNKLKMLTLGRYGDGDDQLTLAKARKALESAKVKLDAGELQATKTATPKTVSDLCDIFYKRRIIKQRRAPEAVLQVINYDIKPTIGHKNIAAISTIAVSGCVDRAIERGAVVHAGKVLAILKQLFKFAEGNGFIDRSPASSLDPKNLGVVNIERKRCLAIDEFKPVWDAINNHPRLSLSVKNALLILMLTGVRTGELLKTQWKNINLDKREWFIPEDDTKSKKAWTVPLTDEVIILILELQGFDDTFVFPGKSGALSDKVTGRAMARLFETGALTIEKVTPHDFRRTIRTHMGKLKIPPHICEKTLNHSLGKIDKTYDQNDYLDERREALERWNEFVMLQVHPQENVISFREAS